MHTSTLYRYGHEPNTHDLVKAIAILLVLIDHFGQYLFPKYHFLRALGRGAAPLFFFLLGTTGKLRIRPSLILYGLILSFTGFIFYQHLWINILLYFIFITLSFSLLPKQVSAKTTLLIFIVAIGIHPFLSKYVEYGTSGFLFAYSARLLQAKDPFARYWLGITLFIYYLWQCYAFQFYDKEPLTFVVALICVILFYVMSTYHLRLVKCPKWCRLPLLILSRYSLEIYFYQLLILQTIFIMSII